MFITIHLFVVNLGVHANCVQTVDSDSDMAPLLVNDKRYFGRFIWYLLLVHRPRQSSSNGESRKCVPVPVLISVTETDGNDWQRFESVRPFAALICRI